MGNAVKSVRGSSLSGSRSSAGRHWWPGPRPVMGMAGVLLLAAGGGMVGAQGDAGGTAAQTGSGAQIYAAQCAGCHGERLQGGFGPALTGAAFKQKWSSQAPAAMLDYIAANMPPGAIGSLTPQQNRDVTGYLVARNSLVAAAPPAAAPDPSVILDETGRPINGMKAASGEEVLDDSARQGLAAQRALLQGLRPVTEAMLRNPPADDWLSWRRTDDGAGLSPLTRITKKNVGRMTLAWSLTLPVGTNETTPLVHDGVLFTNSNGTVFAVDVLTGEVLWKFARTSAPMKSVGVPHTQPRSMAIFGDALYVPTVDNHMLAIDQRTGKLIWDHDIGQTDGVIRPSAGPIIVGGKVIQGLTGCTQSFAGGCFIVALDAASGRELWRFNTLQQPGDGQPDSWNGAPREERQGGGVWATGTYDPETGLIYFGVGQTYHISPLMKDAAAGDAKVSALYTNSTLALDPDSGKLAWHYQHLARDVWDMDWAFERIVMTVPVGGRNRRAVATMGKLGILDVLDAASGQYLFSVDLGLQDLIATIDPATGRKTTRPSAEPSLSKTVPFCPMPAGVRNWPSTAYDSASQRLYIPAVEACTNQSWSPGSGGEIQFDVVARPNSDGKIGQVAAIDLASRKVVWRERRRAPASSAILATATGLVFEGAKDRWFRAFDGRTGQVLWQTRLGNVPNSFPISFGRDGRQFVAVTTSSGNMIEPALRSLTPEIGTLPAGNMLWVFEVR